MAAAAPGLGKDEEAAAVPVEGRGSGCAECGKGRGNKGWGFLHCP